MVSNKYCHQPYILMVGLGWVGFLLFYFAYLEFKFYSRFSITIFSWRTLASSILPPWTLRCLCKAQIFTKAAVLEANWYISCWAYIKWWAKVIGGIDCFICSVFECKIICFFCSFMTVVSGQFVHFSTRYLLSPTSIGTGDFAHHMLRQMRINYLVFFLPPLKFKHKTSLFSSNFIDH